MRSRLAAAVVLVAAAGGAAAMAASLIARDGVEVSILPTVGPARANQSIVRVALDVEARSETAARRLGFHSLRGVTDIDCRSGENQFVKAEAFERPDLQGAAHTWPVLGEWGRPTATSYMFTVTERVCGKGAIETPGPPPIVSAASGPSPAATSSGTESAPTTLAADAAGAPGKPRRAGARTAPPVHLVAHDDQAPPAPTAEAAPGAGAALAVETPPAVRPTPAVHIAAARAAPAPAVRASAAILVSRGGGPAVAQVGASASAADAQDALRALHALIAPPLAGVVEAAEVGGARVYRATVTGFASQADARSFCARAGVKTCWVRPPTAGHATPPASHARPAPPASARPAPASTRLRGPFD